jgi:hypothetical protein
MDLLLAAVAAAFYFFGHPDWAFWFVAAAVMSGLLVVLRSVFDPSWYLVKRRQDGLYDASDYSLKSWLMAKFVSTAILVCAAWWLGSAAEYF